MEDGQIVSRPTLEENESGPEIDVMIWFMKKNMCLSHNHRQPLMGIP